MEDILPRTETSPEDGLKRPEATLEREASLRGILPKEDILQGISPTEDNPMGGIPPRTGRVRQGQTLGPTPDPDRTGDLHLDRTGSPIVISLETDHSLDMAHSPTGLRAAHPPGEKKVQSTSPP